MDKEPKERMGERDIPANTEWTTPVGIVNKIHKIRKKSVQFIIYRVVHTFV